MDALVAVGTTQTMVHVQIKGAFAPTLLENWAVDLLTP